MSMHHTDAYKFDHRSQMPPNTTLVFENWTPRKSRIPGVVTVVWFGGQAHNHNNLGPGGTWEREFFSQPEEKVVGRYARRLLGMGFEIDVQHVRALHRLGYLPIEIWALPEGTSVPIGVPMFVIWNTHPDFAWLPGYLETSMSANIWGPCTSATIAREYRKIFVEAAKRTGGDLDFVNVQGHDFSYRGMYGDYAAALSGAGHLLSFNGTDTTPAIDLLEDAYLGENIGGSVRATEHSVMSMGTKGGEMETYRRLITEVYPEGIVSVVSDTWDFWNVVTETLPALKDEILARDGTLVIRPDSGDPVKILCGDPDAVFGSPEYLGLMRCLQQTFGGETTPEGYIQLNPKVGAIYGDSITLDRAKQITHQLMGNGMVPSCVLGIGSYTYQHVTRDTCGFALKATAGIVDGEFREIFKDPKTDTGEKKSARGLVAVDENLKLRQGVTFDDVKNCAFQLSYRDGHLWNTGENTLEKIRERVRE